MGLRVVRLVTGIGTPHCRDTPCRGFVVGECRDRLLELKGKLDGFARLVNIPAKLEEIQRYEMRMGDPAFWTDQAKAQEMVAALKAVKTCVDPSVQLNQAVQDTRDRLKRTEAEGAEAGQAGIPAEATRLAARYDK